MAGSRALLWLACPALLVAGAALLTGAAAAETGINATWNFTQPGPYDLTLNVSDPFNVLNGSSFIVNMIFFNSTNYTNDTRLFPWLEDTSMIIEQTINASYTGLNWTWSDAANNRTSYGTSITWNFTSMGAYNLSVTVIDPQGSRGHAFFLIEAADRTPPTVELSGPTIIDVFVPANYVVNVTDNDANASYANWSFAWDFLGPGGSATAFTRNASFISTTAGIATLQVRVYDAANISTLTSLTLRINQPPIVLAVPPPDVFVGLPWTWTILTYDPETGGAATGFQLLSMPAGMTISGNTISWTPTADQIGGHNITIALSDPFTTVQQTFSLRVPEGGPAGNHVPTFVSVPLQDARVGRDYSYSFLAWDADDAQNGSLQYFLTYASEPGFVLDTANRLLSWSPPWRPVGNQEFMRNVTLSLLAYDGIAYANQTFTIRFRNPPNQWPHLVGGVGLGECRVGQTIAIHLSANWTDPDDALDLLTVAVNSTDYGVRAAVARVLRWHVEPNGGSPIAVFECIAPGEANFSLVTKDPSGGTSEDSPVTIIVLSAATTNPSSPLPDWLLLLLIAAIAAVGVGAAVAVRRSRAATTVAQEALKTASNIPKAVVQPAEPLAPAGTKKDTYVIEALFIIYQDGRLIHSRTDISQVKFEDPDLVASMFSAVQSFIKDSFGQGELSRLGFGENTIMIERGNQTFMACVIYGEPTADLVEGMKETMRTIENAFAGIIENWDGSADNLAGIEQYVQPFLATTAHLSRGDVKMAITEKGVKMISELEFFQGFVRLKCGVKNDTDSVITKVTVSIDYNEDVLRLHHVEPEGYKRQGSEVQMGVLNSQEKGSLAYYFDPQICTESMIDGVARYRDAKGGVHSVNMKTRKAEVVCPIFFTKEHANTAMLKRLVENELGEKDSKVFEIGDLPSNLKWADVFDMVKSVVLAHDVHIVRDFTKTDPYQAEAWFYGETKVKGYKVVIRASVIEEGRNAEFFAASTNLNAITGLLAEFNHTLNTKLKDKHPDLKMSLTFDPAKKVEVEKKSLMTKMSEADLESGETEQSAGGKKGEP